MLVKTPSQWTVTSAPYVNHLSSVVEKVAPSLLVEIDGVCTNLLHAENLRCVYPFNRLTSPEHPEGGDNLILNFLFFLWLFHWDAGLLGDSRLGLPDKKPGANLLG